MCQGVRRVHGCTGLRGAAVGPFLNRFELEGAGFVVDHADGLFHGLGGDLGSALFCQFVDIGDGGHFATGLLVELEGAEGAIGLEALGLTAADIELLKWDDINVR